MQKSSYVNDDDDGYYSNVCTPQALRIYDKHVYVQQTEDIPQVVTRPFPRHTPITGRVD